jgi:hypothetical protein
LRWRHRRRELNCCNVIIIWAFSMRRKILGSSSAHENKLVARIKYSSFCAPKVQ